MDIEQKLQVAIKNAIEYHDVLGERAFELNQSGKYVIRKDVLKHYYSETEGMVLGLLMEIYHELYGLYSISLPDKMPDGIDRPSQFVWKGAPMAFKLINRFDRGQRNIFEKFFTD